MTAITITDLGNAKLDVDHIAAIATSTAITATDRLGHTKDTIAGAVYKIAGITNRGAWVALTAYAAKDIVLEAGTWYVCVVAHTSSAAFATDTASKWRVYQGVTSGDLGASSGASLVGYMPAGVGAVAATVQEKLYESVSVKDKGATGDGVTDDSAAILLADSEGKWFAYGGDYLYTSSSNPTFAGGAELVNATINAANYSDIVVFDQDGGLIGLHHNHKEQDTASLGSNLAVTTGRILPAPPIPDAVPSPVDVIAHWYQDFGLEYTRAGNGANGSLTWYYWDWNHTDAAGYDESRHPLMGWYRGDDANVLDWQCYWLRKHGVNALSLLPSDRIDKTTWATPSDKYHWLYQLFTNVPNFKGLKYILWGPYSGADIQTQWEYIIDNFYLTELNCYCVEQNGKLYPVMYCFEAGLLLTALGGSAAFITFAGALATRFKNAGYGGVALFMRHPNSHSSLSRKSLEAVDALYFSADYGAHGNWLNLAGTGSLNTVDDAVTYGAMVASYAPMQQRPNWVTATGYLVNDVVSFRGWLYLCIVAHTSSALTQPEQKNYTTNWRMLGPIANEVQAIATSKYAVSAHPSAGTTYWKAQNPTPATFGKWVSKAIKACYKDNAPKIIQIYNVSEWAEGGPGLMPNRQDGFGYLLALKAALTSNKNTINAVFPKAEAYPLEQFVTAASTISCDRAVVILSTDFNRTMTSTPTIAAGVDGQLLRLENNNATYAVTLTDNASLAGSKLYLQAATIVVGPKDSVQLRYSVAAAGWVQTGPMVNIP